VIEVLPATLDHARAIRLRPGDAREIAALGIEPLEALRISLDRSIESHTYLVDGEVAAIQGCGLTALVGGEATPWFLTGEPVERVKKEFLRRSRARVIEMHARFGRLSNYVHAEYVEAIRLMRWLGFQIGSPVPVGPFRAPFVKVTYGH